MRSRLGRTRATRGFTLLELICVLALMGVLTSIGLTAANRWLRMGYAEEARLHLHTLSDLVRGQPGALAACAAYPAQPPNGPVPWQSPPCFERLGFHLESTRFQYQIVVPGPNGAAYSVQARADFDADGVASLYTLASNDNDIAVQAGLE